MRPTLVRHINFTSMYVCCRLCAKSLVVLANCTIKCGSSIPKLFCNATQVYTGFWSCPPLFHYTHTNKKLSSLLLITTLRNIYAPINIILPRHRWGFDFLNVKFPTCGARRIVKSPSGKVGYCAVEAK